MKVTHAGRRMLERAARAMTCALVVSRIDDRLLQMCAARNEPTCSVSGRYVRPADRIVDGLF
jgi:hypothetical protein